MTMPLTQLAKAHMRSHPATPALFLGIAVLMYISEAGAADTLQADTDVLSTIVAGVAESPATRTRTEKERRERGISQKQAPAANFPPAAKSPVDPLCGSSEVLSCSVYAELRGIRDPIRKVYSDKFHAPCAYHDWCYRYGYATYGRTKKACDDLFLMQMQQTCEQVDWLAVATVGASAGACRTAALTFYEVVRNAEKAASAYTKGTLQCRYDGFCPPGKFETTGFLRSCTCPPEHDKAYTGVANETAYCSGTVACPPGRFSTTGMYRGCYCPEGKPKEYELLTGNAYAQCRGLHAACPGGEFGTTGAWRDCDCPAGNQKVHLDPPFNSKAQCQIAVGPGGGGRVPTLPPAQQKPR